MGNYSNGAGGGAGHGGRGGTGLYHGRLSEGGSIYGKPDLPCELGSGTLGPNESVGRVAGGGMIGTFSSIQIKRLIIIGVNYTFLSLGI